MEQHLTQLSVLVLLFKGLLPLGLTTMMIAHVPSVVNGQPTPRIDGNAREVMMSTSCSSNMFFDEESDRCICPTAASFSDNGDGNAFVGDVISIAGIFDKVGYAWGEEILDFTTDMINDGWLDILQPGQVLHVASANTNCDATTAVQAFSDVQKDAERLATSASSSTSAPTTDMLYAFLHAIIGGRFSSASTSLARFANIENIAQLSPFSTSVGLSNDDEFPYFSRIVAPDNGDGEVGALVATLRAFGWDNVGILSTSTQYSKDLEKEFRKIWEGTHNDESGSWNGEVAYSATLDLDDDGKLDITSAITALDSIPVDDPTQNSRIIVLLAHDRDAFPLLQLAQERELQEDTVWVGVSAWTGPRPALDEAKDWLPNAPGYIGLAPYWDTNTEFYRDTLRRFQEWQISKGKDGDMVWDDFPIFWAGYMIDGIIMMVKALSVLPAELRCDGTLVTSTLRTLSFQGLSGPIEFTPNGDRSNALYSIINLQRDDNNGDFTWKDIGSTSVQVGTAGLNGERICFASNNDVCTRTIPDDSYPIPRDRLEVWVIILVIIPFILLVIMIIKYRRSRMSKKAIKAELENFRDSMVGLRAASKYYIPDLSYDDSSFRSGNGGNTGRKKRDSTTARSSSVPLSFVPKAQWCWKENDYRMDTHPASEIFGDKTNCWIKYDESSNASLEAAYLEQGQTGTFSPSATYSVDFDTMIQQNINTGYQRDVQRVILKNDAGDDTVATKESSTDSGGSNSKDKNDNNSAVQVKATIPSEIRKEPHMVLVEGDIIQVSTQRADGWAFGTKVLHADERVARDLVSLATNNAGGGDTTVPSDTKNTKNNNKSNKNNNNGNDDDNKSGTDDSKDINVFTDSGWFPMQDATRVPSSDEMATLKQNVGSTGNLDVPDNWAPIKDPSVVQRHPLQAGGTEYNAVETSFLSTLQSRNAKVTGIERVQNQAMWQSYVVKRQTLCYRETGGAQNTDEQAQQRALARFERSWLWHGTNVEVMEKILQQGFNRSFCGKNATMYGKGVYFARDASYSASTTYAVPDSNNGNQQYIFACRVVVGEYCHGRRDALTPDIRDVKTQSLYDSTVDYVQDPSIFVTYHDAQVYPEYVITFKIPSNSRW